MATQPLPRYDFDAYLATEREAVDARHEYVAGHAYAMTGASYRHNLIVSNLVGELRTRFKDRPCAVLAADMRVRIEAANAAKYPDLVALCGEPRFLDSRRDVLLNPGLLAEVLSPSTEAYDRGGKFAIYRALPSLQEYLLVAQDRPCVEVFTRQPDQRWLLTAHTDVDAEVLLESLGCRIPLREIYLGVSFEPEESAAPAP